MVAYFDQNRTATVQVNPDASGSWTVQINAPVVVINVQTNLTVESKTDLMVRDSKAVTIVP